MSYIAKVSSVINVLDVRPVLAHVYIDHRTLERHVAVGNAYAIHLMLEYDIRMIAYRLGAYEEKEHYLVSRLEPAHIDREHKPHSLFIFPEDF